ncbi:MAG: glycosyltransferase [Flavobacteriales bacterium]|nr:glycosyltransferase [Flavobacteriales bacterium]
MEVVARIIVSVTNDLSTDQRVHRVCETLRENNHSILLVGRKLSSSLLILDRKYDTHRFNLRFNSGPIFYLEYTLRLFFFLLFNKSDVLLSNDLDTLLPNYLVSKLKSIPIVYDSHEYFTGVPELINQPFKRSIWKSIEKNILPKLKYFYTVNKSIAKLYKDEYGVDIKVVRNVPVKSANDTIKLREELSLPIDKKIIILQGAGINIDRGGEEAVEAMRYVDDAVLLIVGSGDVIGKLHELKSQFALDEKVIFVDKVSLSELVNYTANSNLGLTLDKPTNVNYQLSLPNKLFDYIQAGIPVLASNLVEVASIVNKYEIGEICTSHDPKELAAKINAMLSDEALYEIWKSNLQKASVELTWENEKKIVLEIFDQIA